MTYGVRIANGAGHAQDGTGRESNAGHPTVIVIGCGKRKLAREARARDLYTGSLFRACRRYAESRRRPWGILSALHGFVQPDQRIRPYDHRLPQRWQELRCWSISAATGLLLWQDGHGFAVECLAGEAYAAPFCAELERRGVKCTRPLVGMGLGARLRWLGLHATLNTSSGRQRGCPDGNWHSPRTLQVDFSSELKRTLAGSPQQHFDFGNTCGVGRDE